MDHEILDSYAQQVKRRVMDFWRRSRYEAAPPRQEPALTVAARRSLLQQEARALAVPSQARARAAAELLAREAALARIYGRAHARRATPGRATLALPAAPRVRYGGRPIYRPLPSRDFDEYDALDLKPSGGGLVRFEEEPEDAADRYEHAFEVILEDDRPSQEMYRVERIAYNEAVEAVQGGYQAELAESGKARGYQRGVNPDACELCFWLWKEGYVYPIAKPMFRHNGCRCWQIPVTDTPGHLDRPFTDEEQALRDGFYDKYVWNKGGERGVDYESDYDG